MNQNPYTSIFVFATTMLMAVLMATIILVYIKTSGGEPMNTNYNEPIIILGIVAGIVAMPAGIILYRNFISKAKQQTLPDDKLMGVKKAIILRSATWEFGVMVNLIAFYLYNSWISVIMAGVVILLFVALLPTPSRIKNDLEIER